MSKDLKEKTLGELERIVTGMGQKKYLAEYIFHFIHAKDAADISQITPLSKTFREQLVEKGYFISRLKMLGKLTDKDGTTKYVFAPDDDKRIETVLLLDGKRKTLCVSTQVGCAMDCLFCATAKIKFQRNLTAGEIVDQINVAQKDAGRISNVVFMGMGEPLANYDAVIESVRILNHPAGKNIGIRHLTISTCGIVPGIKKLADEDIHPRLSISLNAPTDGLRSSLMPINKEYGIAKILDAVKMYQRKLKERVTFEYVMIKDVNDSTQHAKQLVKLLRSIKYNVNLIEYNPHPACKFKGSSREKMSRFAGILEEAGIETTVRFKKGVSIFAACGQLGANRSENE
jgi:23S rRNA (adenine2503-C2)-methyltransferase